MIRVLIADETGDIAEDKYIARLLRESVLQAALESGDNVSLDFRGVSLATQSFIHALLSRLIRDSNGEFLDRLEFLNCSDNVRAVIRTVVEYSQDAMAPYHPESPDAEHS